MAPEKYAATHSSFNIYIIIIGCGLLIPGTTLETVCQCITHGGTRGYEWGAVAVASNQARMNGTDCMVIYIRAAPDEIIELRFYEIILREGCTDSIQIHPHLRDSIISETARNDDIICAENAAKYISNRHPSAIDQHWADTNSIEWPPRPTTKSSSHRTPDARLETTHGVPKDEPSRPMTMNKQSILSSGSVMAIHLKYGRIEDPRVEYFRASADFRFLKKSLFEVDGNLVPTTLCDYQFLPHPINAARDDVAANMGAGSSWRYFYSPRYPAQYAGHMKCAYKFIGRPQSLVEVVFGDIDLPASETKNNKSCTAVSDRLTVYDSRTADKTTIIDVLCNTKSNKKITSTGPSLLIEFESRSNRTSMGFSAKYRFTDALDAYSNVRRTGNSSNDHLLDASPHLRRLMPPSQPSSAAGPLLLISSTAQSKPANTLKPHHMHSIGMPSTTNTAPTPHHRPQSLSKEPPDTPPNTSHHQSDVYASPVVIDVMNTNETIRSIRPTSDPLLCPPANAQVLNSSE